MASCTVLVLLASHVPQSVNTDEAFQLKALQQYRAGETPSFNHLRGVDPTDITRDHVLWITSWPPSPQTTLWPFVAAGLTLGTAVRAVACLALFAGCLGWVRWWMRFEIPVSMVFAACVMLPWMPYTSMAVFQMRPETLAFATIPWFLLSLLPILKRLDSGAFVPWWQSVSVGLFGGLLFWVKYSLVFIPAASGAMLAWRARRGSRSAAHALAAFIIGCAGPIVLLSVMNRLLAGTVVGYFTAIHDDRSWSELVLRAIGNPALMAGDAGTMLKFGLGDPQIGLLRRWPSLYGPSVALLAAPGGLTMGCLLWHRESLAERVAAITLAVSVVCLLMVWIVISAVSLEPRHLAGGTLASVPACLAVATRRWQQFRPGVRGWLLGSVVLFLALPCGFYGPAAALTHARRAWSFTASAERLYNPFVSVTNARQALAGLLDACADPDAVWYVPDPLTALELPRRLITTDADFQAVESLRQMRYIGRLRVCALLPPKFETNDKGPAIRASFRDVTGWNRHRVVNSAYDLWIAGPAERRGPTGGAGVLP
jgi:hypothetical protein